MPNDVSENAKEYFVSALAKTCKNKYVAFADEINKHFKTDLTVQLPVNSFGKPDWDYMDRYIRAIEKTVIAFVNEYGKSPALYKMEHYGMSEEEALRSTPDTLKTSGEIQTQYMIDGEGNSQP